MFITEKLKNKKHMLSHHTIIISKRLSFLRIFFLSQFDGLAFYSCLFCVITHSLVDSFLKDIMMLDRVKMHPLHRASHPLVGTKFFSLTSM